MIQLSNGDKKLKLIKSNRLIGLRGSLTKIAHPKLSDKFETMRFGGFNLFELNDGAQNANDTLDQLRMSEHIEVGTHIYHTEDSNKPIIPNGYIIITFDTLVNKEEQDIVLDEFSLRIHSHKDDHIVVASCTKDSPNPLKVCVLLEKLSLIHSAEADFDTPLDNYDAFPVDQLLKDQWQFENTGSISFTRRKAKRGADAKIKKAWQFMGNTGSQDIKIALIDNGFDLNHGDFRGKIASPFDIATNSARLLTGNPYETHGTPCASIALANADASGLIGVAPNAQFIPVQKQSFAATDLRKMFQHCMRAGADIISASWGTVDPNMPLNSYKKNLIKEAATKGRNGKGCIILFAAGNEGVNRLNNFAKLPEVIAVGASNSRDEHPAYSNTGIQLSICAPSDGDIPVLAAKASWDRSKSLRDYVQGPNSFHHYKAFGGTSAATPLVAGICALMLSVNPDLYAWEVKEILQSTADKIGDPREYRNGHSLKYGYGRVNALEAVKEAKRRGEKRSENIKRNTPVHTNKDTTSHVDPNANKDTIDLNPPIIQNGSWIIQLGVFSKKSSAERFAKGLIDKHSIRILIDKVPGQNRSLFRVSSQRFETKETAKIFLSALGKKGINGFIKKLS